MLNIISSYQWNLCTHNTAYSTQIQQLQRSTTIFLATWAEILTVLPFVSVTSCLLLWFIYLLSSRMWATTTWIQPEIDKEQASKNPLAAWNYK